MDKFLRQMKEYGSIGAFIIATVIAAAISYGSAQTTSAMTLSNHEQRLNKAEDTIESNTKAIIRMEQHVDDIWHDLGHRE